MQIQYHEILTNQQLLSGVWKLLCRHDHEFVPPLSARESTYQSNLTGHQTIKTEPKHYFEALQKQAFLLAVSEDEVIGFMSFRLHYASKDLNDQVDTIYITTVIVSETHRGKGITTRFYTELLQIAEELGRPVMTRTWSTNDSHIRVLNKMGLKEIKRIDNGRGPGIDTVYYRTSNKEI